MHPWHDILVDENTLELGFSTVIEVPKGSKNKYELDKKTGFLRLDRVLYSAVHYPADYGFVPQTYCEDNDPIDVLVLGQESVPPLTIIEARAIGVMRMRDEKGIDDKLIAVSIHDPAFSQYTHHNQLPQHWLREMKHFFSDYKTLEHKEVLIEDFLGPDEARVILKRALEMYRSCIKPSWEDMKRCHTCPNRRQKQDGRIDELGASIYAKQALEGSEAGLSGDATPSKNIPSSQKDNIKWKEKKHERDSSR